MKKLIYVLVASLLVLSCSKDDSQEVIQFDSSQESNLRGPQQGNNPGAIDAVQLEKTLQWVSYITGVISIDNSSYTSMLNSNLSLRKTIPLEDLIGSSPISISFKNDFLEEVESAIQTGDIQCPGTQSDPPPIPPSPNGNGEPIANVGQERTFDLTVVQPFLDWVLDDNCIELYFPTGMNHGAGDSITSTAHPLDNTNDNNGYRHASASGLGSACSSTYAVPNVTEDYVSLTQSWNHVVMARPFNSSAPGSPCDYTSLPVSNLRTYLAGPF